MELKLTETELQFLAEKYSGSEISFVITGPEKFTVFHPKAEVSCKILGFTKRSIVVGYNMGFWKNLLVKWFVKFEKEGILWDKKQRQLKIDPFSFLPQKEKTATADFSIQRISLEPGFLLIQLGVIPEQN
ncbi:hypothetical protein [Algoriphagus sp. A40]|uniref:hypothetical protein n=1 Tax=Algoriphagus sp. A40 TaxID=1945863 RepID=UPI0009874431|nr:hypothetical protein [Algoriphagus sp. A40]OOG72822.1 hypothetical protein B0E43_15300 [Algoriphagus sp. A40]